MSDVDWNSVGPQKRAEQQETGGPLGTVVFIVLLLVGLVAGGAYINSLVLKSRVREIVVAECEAPTCSTDIQLSHAACFDEHVTYGMPSLADFQTSNDSPTLGIGSVNLDGYRTCVMPKKTTKTLADPESK